MKIMAKITILSAIAFCSGSIQAAMVSTTFDNETAEPVAIIHGKMKDSVSAKSKKKIDIDTNQKLFVYTNVMDDDQYEVNSNIFRISRPSDSMTITFQARNLDRRDIHVHGGVLRDSSQNERKFDTAEQRRAHNKSQVDIFISLGMSSGFYHQHSDK